MKYVVNHQTYVIGYNVLNQRMDNNTERRRVGWIQA